MSSRTTPPAVAKAIGRRVRAHRQAAKILQQDLAEAVGTNRQHVGFIESGARAPSLGMLVQIAIVLRVPLRDLVP